MTIHTFYFVLGFRVKRSDYMKKMGYTKEKYLALPPRDGFSKEETDSHMSKLTEDELRGYVNEWFCIEHLDERSLGGGFHRFTVGGYEWYIAREITHDHDNGGDFIVGLDMGYVNLDGTTDMKTRLYSDLEDLMGHEEWTDILIGDAYVRNVTDDCRCCS